MNTEEGNRLIAEFMGWSEIKVQSCLKQFQHPLIEDLLHVENFRYNSDWNWLMPVIEKIEGEKAVVNMHRHWGALPEDPIEDLYFCTIKIHKGKEIDVAYVDSKIEAVYKAVVEFIKWYNENEKP